MLTGKDLIVDPQTGFLEARPGGKAKITAKQKAEFLEIFREIGNVSEACKMVGISGRSLHYHKDIDQPFALAYKAVINDLCDKVEGCLYQAAVKTKNVTAMFGFLRAYRNQVYGDKKVTERVETKTERVKKLLNNLKEEGNLIELPSTQEKPDTAA